MERFAANPTAGLPDACDSSSETCAAYRFLGNVKASWRDIRAPHWEQTQARIRAQPVVLCIQDKQLFADHEDCQVSHETIYRSLYIQRRPEENSWSTCGVPDQCAVHAITRKRPAITAGSLMPYRSVKPGHGRRSEGAGALGRRPAVRKP